MRIALALLLIFSLLMVQKATAQNSSLALGAWQVHVPNNRAKAIAAAEDKIYCATEEGFFLYDKAYNQLQTLSKVNGFHEVGISTLGYEPETKTLLIAYENTNIDLIQNGEIINLNDIFRKDLPGDKQIYHLYFNNKVAYISGSFGVVLLDLVKLEIKDTYSNLGSGGQPLPVYTSTLLNDSLYLATANGILAARITGNNLLDYRNWHTFTPADGLPAATNNDFKTIAAFNNKIYAGINNKALYQYNGQRWFETQVSLANKVCYTLKTFSDNLWIIDSDQIRLLDKENKVKVKDAPHLIQPRDALPETETEYWVADYQHGLVKVTGTQSETLVPGGPAFSNAFRLYADSKAVIALGGGYNQSYAPGNLAVGFSVHQNGQWQNYNKQQYPGAGQFPAVPDLVSVIRNPSNQKLYFASYGAGLLEWEEVSKFKIYDADNSPLISSVPGNKSYTRIPGVAADAEGNIWVTNRSYPENGPGLHVLHLDGSWQSFNMPGFTNSNNLEKIIVDANGYKWMTVARAGSNSRGVVVFDEKINQYRHLTTSIQMGNLPGNDVYTLALDKDGLIWVGTDRGIAVFDRPEQVFESPGLAAVIPIIDGRPLLENQVIRAIAVDGGNRKWVGTETGIWLLSPDGDAIIAHFTSHNSPLLSDKIIDIAINNSTGEVFISTEAGLNAYRGTATETVGKPECSLVYPNPVRPGYTGLVGISGLPNNAQVKITDITGTLIFQTQATGGTVTWNLKDSKGKRVKTGVYLALSTSPDGGQACISKIAVVD